MHFLKQLQKSNKLGELDRYISCRNHNVLLCKKKKIIKIYANIFTYGGAADKKITKQIATNIQWHWNFPKAKAEINKVQYLVQFKIKPIYFPGLSKKIIDKNKDQKNIFIRLEEQLSTDISIMDGVCSNTGFFKKANIGYKGATTEAHEYGHALGLWPGEANGHPQDTDQRGKGVPGIMYPRGSWVDAKYQWYPNVAAGETGGTLMPDCRRVRQLDIDMLFLASKKITSKSTCRLGRLSNRYHNVDFGMV